MALNDTSSETPPSSSCTTQAPELASQPGDQVLFTFGVVADVQYGDKDNEAAKSDPSRTKRYREAPKKLAAAIEHFNSLKPSLRCVLTLGDIIDGNETEELSAQDFEVVRGELQKLEVEDVYHAIGNHCLSLPRDKILQGLGMARGYYDVELHPGWRLVVLDSMDLSISWPEGSPQHTETADFLKDHPLGSDNELQMQTWNGGIGREQLGWLAKILAAADASGERVILALHHPVARGSAPDNLLLWNHEELTICLAEHPSVKMVVCGHYHPGGYTQSNGVHFVTFEGMVEAPTDSEAYALVQVFLDRVEIKGYGFVSSRVCEMSDNKDPDCESI